ncbi:3-ketoacyl-ACP reductase [Algoriphagus namhaensis]
MNKVALVTGGSRGIGFGIAMELAQAGFALAINGVRHETEVLESLNLLKKYSPEVIYLQGNIAQAKDREYLLSEMKTKFGRIDLLVNNAGVAPRVRNDVFDITEEEYDYVVDVNEKGTFFLTQIFAKWMAELSTQPDHTAMAIVTITSVSAVLASTLRMSYCMSKASASMMSKVMAIKMAPFGVNVYEIRPGFMDTDMIEKVRDTYLQLVQEGATLEPRIGKPQDVGKIVKALALGEIPYATGQIINVDGGLTIERM